MVLQDKKEKLLIQQINLVQEELTQLENDLKIFQQTQDYVQASKIKYETIPQAKEKIAKLEEQAKNNVFRNYLVEKKQVAFTIAQKYNLDVNQILLNEQKRLFTLLPVLQERIKGQDKVLRTIVDAIIRSRVGIQDPKKPLASFFLLVLLEWEKPR